MKKNLIQFGVITYPKLGNVRAFVLAYAPTDCTIVWCDGLGYAKLCR
jgi:hypothetical protein